jgi:hypothetical protein
VKRFMPGAMICHLQLRYLIRYILYQATMVKQSIHSQQPVKSQANNVSRTSSTKPTLDFLPPTNGGYVPPTSVHCITQFKPQNLPPYTYLTAISSNPKTRTNWLPTPLDTNPVTLLYVPTGCQHHAYGSVKKSPLTMYG